jgi:hypothetical protein
MRAALGAPVFVYTSRTGNLGSYADLNLNTTFNTYDQSLLSTTQYVAVMSSNPAPPRKEEMSRMDPTAISNHHRQLHKYQEHLCRIECHVVHRGCYSRSMYRRFFGTGHNHDWRACGGRDISGRGHVKHRAASDLQEPWWDYWSSDLWSRMHSRCGTN